MAYIELSGKRGKGRRTLVDEDIYKKYGGLSWYLSDTGYALRKPSDGIVRLHRLVIEAKEGEIVDHKNRDKLDNRRSNLRIVTHSQNAFNRRHKGYSWDKSKQKFIVSYRRKFYGRYKTEVEAKRAYQLACSGLPYEKTRRKYWNLPTGITKQFGKYRVRPQRNGKRIWLGQFTTLEEAQNKLNEWKNGG